MNSFFVGLKVVELASVLAGPAVGMFFAELGAEVIKVENSSTQGDMTRQWKLPSEDSASRNSAYFASINYGKRHIFKNFNDSIQLNEVIALIHGADVVINNLKAESAAKFGLDEPSLRSKSPGLIYASITGFKSSPNKTAFDAVLQAETGFLSMTGSTKGELAKMPVAMIDVLTAHQVKEAILMALLKKERTGKGSNITCSLEETALASLINQASNYLMEGHVASPLGTLHPNIAPYGELVETNDQVTFILAIGTDQQFVKLCTLLNSEDLTTAEQYSTNHKRVSHREELLAALQQRIAQLDAESFEKACLSQKVPIGRVRKLDDVLSSPLAKEMTLTDDNKFGKMSRLKSIAFSLD
jgi:crotonobetainyl-CoA:carnitine CoA-transferase CaiB-like acyl-CoA transferase